MLSLQDKYIYMPIVCMLLGYLFSSVFHECLKRYSKCKSKKSLFCTENIVVLVLCGGRASVYVVVLRDWSMHHHFTYRTYTVSVWLLSVSVLSVVHYRLFEVKLYYVYRNQNVLFIISSPCHSGNVSYCHYLVRQCRPSVNFSHFNLLLWNPLAKWTETW